MPSNERLRPLSSENVGTYSFPSQSDAVKAFALSKERSAWRGESVHDQLAHFTNFLAAVAYAQRFRVQGTRFTIDEVPAAVLKAAPGYVLLIHRLWGQQPREVKLDFASKTSLADFLSALPPFEVVPYVLSDEQRESLLPLTSRLRSWSSYPRGGVDEYLSWDKGSLRSSGHLIRTLCAVMTTLGHGEVEEGHEEGHAV